VFGLTVFGVNRTHPDDDIAITVVEGKMKFAHKDGTPY
jgi:hypothetical protein